MRPHANARMQALRAKCPDAVIQEHARRIGMHVALTFVSGTEEQWDDLETILTSTDRATLSELQVKYE